MQKTVKIQGKTYDNIVFEVTLKAKQENADRQDFNRRFANITDTIAEKVMLFHSNFENIKKKEKEDTMKTNEKGKTYRWEGDEFVVSEAYEHKFTAEEVIGLAKSWEQKKLGAEARIKEMETYYTNLPTMIAETKKQLEGIKTEIAAVNKEIEIAKKLAKKQAKKDRKEAMK